MTEDERAIMVSHVAYWTELLKLAFGPVLDPREVYGLGIIVVNDEQEVKNFISCDPAATINNYEYFPMKAIVPER